MKFKYKNVTFAIQLNAEGTIVYRDEAHLGGPWSNAIASRDNRSLDLLFRRELSQCIDRIESWPKIEIVRDYDDFFRQLVLQWCESKIPPFKHKTIRINAGPNRPDVVTFVDNGDMLCFDFYSAFRSGFGSLSDKEIKAIIELL